MSFRTTSSVILSFLAYLMNFSSVASANESLEELHLADNADIAEDRMLEYEPSSPTCSDNKMEVADSDDEEAAKLDAVGNKACSASSGHRSCVAGSPFIQELAAAIESAVHLQLLDLSRNRLPSEAVEVLYGSWSLPDARCDSVFRHVTMDKGIVHFGIEGKRCCGIKSCCKKD